MTVLMEDGGIGRGQGVLRDLGFSERTLSLHSDGQPMHFCMVCEVAGPTAAGDYQAAFDRVQARHPFLAASIEAGVPGRIRRSTRPVAVSVLPRAGAPEWARVVERELSSPFHDREGPLMRVTVLHEAERATIVCCFHHVLADGLSGAYIIHDLMQALTGAPLKPRSPLPKRRRPTRPTFGRRPHCRARLPCRQALTPTPFDRSPLPRCGCRSRSGTLGCRRWSSIATRPGAGAAGARRRARRSTVRSRRPSPRAPSYTPDPNSDCPTP